MKRQITIWKMIGIISSALALAGGLLSALLYFDKKVADRVILEQKSRVGALTSYYRVMSFWLTNYKYMDLPGELKSSGINRVAIYGKGFLGNMLYEQLKDTDVEVVCFIDQDAKYMKAQSSIPAYTPDDANIPLIDAIIISIYGNPSVWRDLSEKYHNPGNVRFIGFDQPVYRSFRKEASK